MNSFRRALIERDVLGLMKLWKFVSPHLPQPTNYAEAEITMHRARTEAESVPVNLRVYSHKWLTERGYQSGLPDELKPKPERVYPVIVSAVGIMVKSSDPELRREIATAMSNAVMEMYADGDEDETRVHKLMMERRAKVKRCA